jgi:hypothetical protein
LLAGASPVAASSWETHFPHTDDEIEVTGTHQQPIPPVQIGGSSVSNCTPAVSTPRAEEEEEFGSVAAWNALAARLRRVGPAVVAEGEELPERHIAMGYLCPQLEDDVTAREACGLYELLPPLGTEPSCACQRVVEFYSPPRVNAKLRALPFLSVEPGSKSELKEDCDGAKWDFLHASG